MNTAVSLCGEPRKFKINQETNKGQRASSFLQSFMVDIHDYTDNETVRSVIIIISRLNRADIFIINKKLQTSSWMMSSDSLLGSQIEITHNLFYKNVMMEESQLKRAAVVKVCSGRSCWKLWPDQNWCTQDAVTKSRRCEAAGRSLWS